MEITVYGTPVCPTCKNVTSYLEHQGVCFDYKTIGQDIDKSEIDRLTARDVRSVPVILVDGIEIVFDDLKQQLNQLQPQMLVGLAL